MQYNPIKGKLPHEPREEYPTLGPDKLLNIFQHVPLREKEIIGLGIFAGLRMGEIFGLQWKDIDFKNNTIFIQRQYSSGIIGEFKTDSSKSMIPIWDHLAILLKTWKLQCGSHTWLFKSKKFDKTLRPERWRQLQWIRIKKEYELPNNLRFHDLKHSFATILLTLGADKGDVQKLLRHKSISITMDIYQHLQPKTLSRVFEIFDSLSGEDRGEGRALNQ